MIQGLVNIDTETQLIEGLAPQKLFIDASSGHSGFEPLS